jgi:hypothetical protein
MTVFGGDRQDGARAPSGDVDRRGAPARSSVSNEGDPTSNPNGDPDREER